MVTIMVVAVLVIEPLQPVKLEPGLAVAVNITTVPCSNKAPTGSPTTVPEPVPAVVTVSSYWLSANVAVMVFAWS